MLETITPVLITYNEEDNIGRVLDRLRWARDIVVVDSHSTDRTLEIIGKFPQVRVLQYEFDCHANKWNFAVHETGIRTEWVLCLDADYLLPDEFVEELRRLVAGSEVNGFRADFRLCVRGRPLRASLYPSVTVLYRRNCARYFQDGHTQRLRMEGSVKHLTHHIFHDDRKPLLRWLRDQYRDAELEAKALNLANWSDLGMADRIRKFPPIAPFLVFAYCLFVKGLWRDGRAGLYYATQRMITEAILVLALIEQRWSDSEKR